MQLTIDNFDGSGARDYTGALDSERLPTITRRLNRPSTLGMSLAPNALGFVLPKRDARVLVTREDGEKLFTGYVTAAPEYEYVGWGECGAVYRLKVTALSDEYLLDRRAIAVQPPFVECTAGGILKSLTSELAGNQLETGSVADVEVMTPFTTNREKNWSDHAAELGLLARAAYRVHDGAVSFASVAADEFVLDESANSFAPEGLKLQSPSLMMNDVTVIGVSEPQAYVKDYFLGDERTLSFTLSEPPFMRMNSVFVDEEWAGTTPDPLLWIQGGNAGAVSVAGGKLQVAGGQVTLQLNKKIEMGGGLVLQHGDVLLSANSSGLIGGLFAGGTDAGHAMAAFQVSTQGSQMSISAVVSGATAGTPITVVSGHRYVMTTCVYASEVYRREQSFHSSAHPGGSGRGGDVVPSRVRVVLQVHDIDPANPTSQAAPATVLYEGTINSVPTACDYLLVSADSLHCDITYTRLSRVADVKVQSTIPGNATRTRLVGALSDGGECGISTTAQLYFYSPYVPVLNEAICATYRSSGQAIARVTDPASIAANVSGSDDGVRSGVERLAAPGARTSAECEQAARALLEDSTQVAWSGEYQAWSDSVPASDVWPGDGVHVMALSRGADFQAIVREVDLEVKDLASDRCWYKVRFANDAAALLAFAFQAARTPKQQDVMTTTAQPAAEFAADLPDAEVTAISSTTITLDVGVDLASGGVEVRRSDYGWGTENDRNLVGRFTTRSITLTRLSRVQTYYMRQYDAEGLYSRHTSVLHVDYPL